MEPQSSSWMRMLEEMVSRIKYNVTKVYSKKHVLSVSNFKNLLDLQAQEAIITILEIYDVSAKLISEEGDELFGDGEYTIIADPLDGTTNMARGLPPAVSAILVSETDRLSGSVASIIMNLFSGDVYKAERGRGAFQNDNPIHSAQYIPLKNALLSLDISKNPRLKSTSKLIKYNEHIRGLGCSAMSLCYVADGTLDAHVDIRGILRNTDVAAALMILKETGGIYSINGEKGTDLDLSKMNTFELIAASNEAILDEITILLG
jgi:myo-inositol-1(or 4)-monophosphatase